MAPDKWEAHPETALRQRCIAAVENILLDEIEFPTWASDAGIEELADNIVAAVLKELQK